MLATKLVGKLVCSGKSRFYDEHPKLWRNYMERYLLTVVDRFLLQLLKTSFLAIGRTSALAVLRYFSSYRVFLVVVIFAYRIGPVFLFFSSKSTANLFANSLLSLSS